jgi:hypothetical protein
MNGRVLPHHAIDQFRESTDDFTTYPAFLIDQFVETRRINKVKLLGALMGLAKVPTDDARRSD